MYTEGPATYSHRFQLCAMLLPSVDKSSKGIFLQNPDLPNTSSLYMAIWEYPFRHALATFLAERY